MRGLLFRKPPRILLRQQLRSRLPIFTPDPVPLVSARKDGSRAVFVVISKKVASLFPETVRGLKKKGLAVIEWNDGEKTKTAGSKEKLEAELLKSGIDRSSTLAVIGGGTLLDLCGFTAATLFRGIDWIAVPTTLLAMVDASVGGKTGINNGSGKNLVGAFHFPGDVIVWLPFLTTLPQKERRNGLAECVKHGLIRDEDHYLESLNADLDDRKNAEKIIRNSQKIKMRIVKKDPFEVTGERNLLNFGHTVGHGLEKWSGYKMAHGEAVYLGMAWETAVSHLEGYCDRLAFRQIKGELLKAVRPGILKVVSLDSLWRCMVHDKKSRAGTIFYVPLGRAGMPALPSPYVAPMNLELLKKSYKLMMEE